MYIKCTFEIVPMGDEIVLVPIGESAETVHGIVKLNQEGLEIVELLKTDTTEEKIVDYLADKYENDKAQLTGYVRSAVSSLRNAGLLNE